MACSASRVRLNPFAPRAARAWARSRSTRSPERADARDRNSVETRQSDGSVDGPVTRRPVARRALERAICWSMLLIDRSADNSLPDNAVIIIPHPPPCESRLDAGGVPESYRSRLNRRGQILTGFYDTLTEYDGSLHGCRKPGVSWVEITNGRCSPLRRGIGGFRTRAVAAAS